MLALAGLRSRRGVIIRSPSFPPETSPAPALPSPLWSFCKLFATSRSMEDVKENKALAMGIVPRKGRRAPFLLVLCTILLVLVIFQAMQVNLAVLASGNDKPSSLSSMWTNPFASPALHSVFEDIWFFLHSQSTSASSSASEKDRLYTSLTRVVKPSVLPYRCARTASSLSEHSPQSSDLPTLFNVHTRTRVIYDGGQWFHMAENLLAQHSILKTEMRLSNSSVVIYNFDQVDFHKTMNPFTRFVTLLSTRALHTQRQMKYAMFMSNPVLAKHLGERKRDDVFLTTEMLADTDTINFMTSSRSLLHAIPRAKQHHSVPTADRFLLSSSHHTHNKRPHLRGGGMNREGMHPHRGDSCVHNLGSVGGLVPRGQWFPTAEDVQDLRAGISALCPRNDTLIYAHRKRRKYKLLIYNRDQSRTLINAEQVLSSISHSLPNASDWEIFQIIHSNTWSPCELAHALHNVDVLVTPHGFQSMLLLFLPRPAILFEVFPSPYFKQVYRVVGKEFGLIHGHAMSPPTSLTGKIIKRVLSDKQCNAYSACRNLARSQDVILTEDGRKTLLQLIIEYLPELNDVPVYNHLDSARDKRRKFLPVARDVIYNNS